MPLIAASWQVDEEHDAYLHTVYPDLHAANFGFESEMTIDTPSLADLRAARALSRGRLKGHRVRTLPPTPPTVPRELHAVQADEDVRCLLAAAECCRVLPSAAQCCLVLRIPPDPSRSLPIPPEPSRALPIPPDPPRSLPILPIPSGSRGVPLRCA